MNPIVDDFLVNEPKKYLSTYTADNATPFLACAVDGCRITFPHEVGITEDHKWKHVWADFYYPAGPTQQ
jgi:hypothetical protein